MRRLALRVGAALGVAVALAAAPARAQSAAEAVGASPAGRSPWSSIDLAVLAGSPAALGSGLSLGPSAHLLLGDRWVWGAELGYVSATEYTQSWAVVHDEGRLRILAGVRQALGRARLVGQLGLGATVLHESRNRAQASRLNGTGVATTASAWALLPAADLRAGVHLPIYSDWGVALVLGPSAHLRDSELEFGWSAALSAGWLP